MVLRHRDAAFVPAGRRLRHYYGRVERKIFWITFGALGLIADLALPFWWAMLATLPIVYFSWWLAYRSGSR